MQTSKFENSEKRASPTMWYQIIMKTSATWLLKIGLWSYLVLQIIFFHISKMKVTLRQKYPYSELFWSAFSRIRTEHGEILRISPYSVRKRENTDQKNFEYGHFTQC